MIVVQALAVLVAASAALARVPQAPDVEARAAELCVRLAQPARSARAFSELLALGGPAAGAALEGFEQASLEARRARSLVVREVARAGVVARAIEVLEQERDGEVRANLLGALARPELRAAAAGPRAAALERVAAADPEPALRTEAIRALGRIDHSSAAGALERLMEALGAPHRAQAARALASQPAARERVVERVQAAFDPSSSIRPLATDALAELFGPAYGLRLAEVAAGGTRPRDIAPFVLGERHPAADVRAGASLALDRFVARARFLGDVSRADRVLAELIGRGLDDRNLLARRARLALESGSDADVALEAARALRVLVEPGDDVLSLRRRGQAGLLEAASLLAVGRVDEVPAALAEARTALEAVIGLRLDLRSPREVSGQVTMLERLALVELYSALAILWTAPDPSQPAVLAHAREAHELSLRAQVALTAQWVRVSPDASWPPRWGLDSVLDDALSPWTLLFSNTSHPHVPAPRALELQRQLLGALASVAPLEVPGFQRIEVADPALADPRADPRRSALLSRLLREYQGALEDLVAKAASVDPEDGPYAGFDHRARLMQAARVVAAERGRDEGTTWHAHLRLRVPTDAALPLAEELRAEGRTEAARAVAQRVLDDLRAGAEVLQGAYGEELTARAEVALGAAWMDDDEPHKAEELYARALERLDVVERDLSDRGAGEGALATLRLRQADVLVSLAVNANVKLREPEQAVEYFERAYDLRQDDFMRVLLACYRARVGRDPEARAVLRDLPVSPANYYNLACTYALLGERELALDFLRRDFAEMRSSPGQLERQKQWARGDPDLEALLGHPGFESLVAPSEELSGQDGR